jgi:peptide/nickel transport system permease protein
MIRWNRFLRSKGNIAGLLLVMMFVFVALAAPWLAPPKDPDNPEPFKATGQQFQRFPEAPSSENVLGTIPQIQNMVLYGFTPGQDASYQWDVYYTLIWGTRSALRFGLVVTLLTAVFGISVGALSGYYGGLTGSLMMRVTDAFLVFPAIAAIWLFQRVFFANILSPYPDLVTLTPWESVVKELQIDPIMIALIVFSWMPYARLVNSSVSRIRQAEYIEAAESMGATGPRIIFRHLLPNAISPAVVLAARDVGGMVILACTFIFLGFGGHVTWGIMLVTSRDYVIGVSGNPFTYWWTFVPVSLALILFGVGWNLLGDGLNSALNPRRRH